MEYCQVVQEKGLLQRHNWGLFYLEEKAKAVAAD
jgi:hypothetical protein